MKKLAMALAGLVCGAAFASEVVEVKVVARDGFGGDTGTVASRCQTKVGGTYDPVTVTRDVTSLKDTGEFEDISADAEKLADGVSVTFFVKRKMRYQAPGEVVGCDYMSASKVLKNAELKDGYLYGEGDLAAAAARVKFAYQKKYFLDAQVRIETEAMPGGNNCRVRFVIDEGRRQKIRRWVFEGAANVEQSVLRDAVGDLPWWNPMGWFNDPNVTADQLAQCVAKAEDVYRDLGYADVRMTGPERVRIEGDDEGVNLVVTVDEGVRYRIGAMSVKGLTRYSEGVVKEKSALPAAGEFAGKKALEDAAHRVKVTVGSGDLGLADTRVDYKCVPSLEDPEALDVVFEVTEGVPVVINEVVIRGNDYTMDKVIRREIALGPGDRMLEDRAERSQKRLENLDYFSRVRYYLEQTDLARDPSGAEYRNLVYEVEEKNTGSFMVGVGASSVDSIYLSAEVQQSNFDLFAPGKFFRGAGQKARASVQWGPRIQTIEASVTEPHLFGRLLELTVEGYRRGRWYDEYDLYRTGPAVSLSYPVKFWPTWGAFGRLGVKYWLEYVQYDDTDSNLYWYDNKWVSVAQEESDYGDKWQSVARIFWSRDSRDNFRTPGRGCRSQLFFDITPGGDNQFWRLGLHHRHYFTVWERYHHVFMWALRFETIDAIKDEVPIHERMFLGGPRSIRGVKYRNVSPYATSTRYTDSGIPWGGKSLFCMNFEYTVPIVRMLRIAAFSDLGSVGADTFDLDFSDTFAWTVGLGVRIDIPMFPIRLDFGFPITLPDAADKEAFSFTVGYDF